MQSLSPFKSLGEVAVAGAPPCKTLFAPESPIAIPEGEEDNLCFPLTPTGGGPPFHGDLETPTRKTAFMEIKNLKNPLFKDHFLFTLNEDMREAGLIRSHETSAISCSDASSNCVLVEFRTTDEASTFCSHSWEYGGMRLHTQQRTQASPCVKIFNTPDPLFKDHLVHYLSNEIPEIGRVNVTSCVKEEDHVLIEFQDADVAASLCRLRTIPYGRTSLRIEPGEVPIPRVHNDATSLEDIDVAGLLTTNSIESQSGTQKFLEVCVKMKKAGNKFKGSTANFEIIREVLLSDCNISTTVEECKCRYKRVLDSYRRLPERYSFRAHVKYLRDEPGATRPPRTTPPNLPIEDVEVFTGFNSRNTGFSSADNDEPTLELICILVKRKDEYRSVHKDNVFWGAVCKEMVEAGYSWATPAKCKAHFKGLECKFKDYDKARSRTGAEGSRWVHYDGLLPVLGDSVAVQAFKTFSFGARNAATVTEALLEEGDEVERVGRHRAQSSKHKQKMEILKKVVESRIEMCQTIKILAEALRGSNNNRNVE